MTQGKSHLSCFEISSLHLVTPGLGFRVQGLGFRVQGLGVRDEGLGSVGRVRIPTEGSGCEIWTSTPN